MPPACKVDNAQRSTRSLTVPCTKLGWYSPGLGQYSPKSWGCLPSSFTRVALRERPSPASGLRDPERELKHADDADARDHDGADRSASHRCHGGECAKRRGRRLSLWAPIAGTVGLLPCSRDKQA